MKWRLVRMEDKIRNRLRLDRDGSISQSSEIILSSLFFTDQLECRAIIRRSEHELRRTFDRICSRHTKDGVTLVARKFSRREVTFFNLVNLR